MANPVGDSNMAFDIAPSVIVVPDYEVVKGTFSEEELISRLDRLQSPKERLKQLFLTTIDLSAHDVTHESQWIRQTTFCGFGVGMLFGGILNSQDYHDDYIRKHNADVFEGKYRGNRHFWDSLFYRVIGRGSKMGLKAGLLCGTATFIALGSINYRNRLYYPDWLVGFTALGGLSRLWLGARAVAVGGLCGFVASLIGYGLGRCSELFTGQKVTYFRTLSHTAWLEQREATLRRKQIASSELHNSYMDEVFRGQD